MTRAEGSKAKQTAKQTQGQTPWAVECLGPTLRVVDVEGNDMALIGDVTMENRAIAERIVKAVNAQESAS